MDPLLLLALTVGVLALAALGHGTFGFGGGLIAIPLLSLFIGVRDAVTLALILQLTAGLLVLRVYASLNRRRLVPVLIGLVPGVVMGTYLLSSMPESALRLALSVFILLYLVKAFFYPDLALPSLRRRGWGVIAGALGGIIQGFIGMGGPPVVVYLKETIPEKGAFRATLLLLIFASNVIRAGVSMPAGLFTGAVLETAIYAVPFVLPALWVGEQLSRRLDERYYAHTLHGLLFCAVIALLVRA